MKRALVLGFAWLVLSALDDGCDDFNDQQKFCYHFCREQLQGRAQPITHNRTDFLISTEGEKSYCWCRVRVQLPTKIPVEAEK